MRVFVALLLLVWACGGEGYNVIYACDKCLQFETLSDWANTFIRAIRAKIDPIGGTFKLVNANYFVDPDDVVAEHIQTEVTKSPGFQHVVTTAAGTFTALKLALKMPDLKITVNQAWAMFPLPNFQGLAFREDQLGYLAGILAGLQTSSGRVACLGGPKFAGVQSARNSFAMGVRSVCPMCTVDGIFANTFQNESHGRDMARLLVQRGADVVFGYAGVTSSAGIWEVAGDAYVIGSGEFDEWETTFGKDNGTKGTHFLGTALRDMTLALNYSLQDGIDGKFQSGWKMMDVRNKGVRLTECRVSCPAITALTRESIQRAVEDFRLGLRDTGVEPMTGELKLSLGTGMYTSLGDHFGDGASASARMALMKSKVLFVQDTYNEAMWYNGRSHSVDHLPSRGQVPSPRTGAAVVGVGVRAFVVGGLPTGGSDPLGDVHQLEFPCRGIPGRCGADPLWTRVSSGALPPRHSHSVVANGSTLFLYGGIGERVHVADDLWYFDTETMTAKRLTETSANGARYDHSATTYHSDVELEIGVVDKDFMLVFGGRSAGDVLDHFMAYGLNTGTWGAVDSLGLTPEARWGACLVAANNRVLLMGGVGKTGPLNDVWVYSPTHRTWTLLGEMKWKGQMSCVLDESTKQTDVTDHGLPEYVTTFHRVLLVGETQDTHFGGFGVFTFPSIKCNNSMHLVHSPDGVTCTLCPNGTVAAEGKCRPCSLFDETEVAENDRLRERCPLPEPSTVDVGLVVGLVAAGVVVLSIPAVWYSTRNYRHMRKVLNTNKVITEVAESVAQMDFEAVAYLHQIDKPTKVQLAFIRIVDNLKEYKAYMPQSLFAERYKSSSSSGSDDPPTEPPTDKTSTTRSSATSDELLKAMRLDVASRITRRPVSLVYCNVRDFHNMMDKHTSAATLEIHSKLVAGIVEVAKAGRGVPDTFQGDRIVLTFNAVSHCSVRTQAASTTALQIVQMSGIRVECGVDTGKAYCGNMGCGAMKKFTVAGPVVSTAYLLCTLNKQLGTSILMSSWAHNDLPSTYDAKVMGWMMYPKKNPTVPTVVYSLVGLQAVDNDEWMYQLSKAERANNFAQYNRAALSLMNADSVDELTDSQVEEYEEYPYLHHYAQRRELLPPLETLDIKHC